MGRMQTLGTFVPQVAVLCLLASLLTLGHLYHWTIPKASELKGAAPSAAVGDEPCRLVPMAGGEFPAVVFRSAEEVRRGGIAVEEVTRKDVEETVTANGSVAYDRARVAQLSPRTAGRVTHVFKQLGQAVAAGEVLALIDAEEVGRAKVEYLQETALSAHKLQALARLRANDGGSVPDRTVRDAEAAAAEAGLRRFAAHEKLHNLGIAADLPEDAAASPEEMARRLQFAGIPPETIDRLEPRPRTSNLIPIAAPFAGVVTQQDAVVGQFERPDHPAMTVADVSRMWVWASVRKEDSGRVRPGQPVEFRVDGRPTVAHGRVGWVSTELDPKTRTVQVRADMGNPFHSMPSPRALAGPGAAGPESEASPPPDPAAQRDLMANMFGTARVRVARAEEALLVPDRAIQTVESGGALQAVAFVARPDGLTFEPRALRLGRSADGLTAVAAGLRAGERVAVAGSHVLKSELMKETLTGGN